MQREMEMVRKHALLLHIKSFLASPAQYLAARRHLSALGTQVARWSDIRNFDAAWDARTAMIGGMIRENASVLEFGSGREQLEKYLPKGTSYQPSDLAPRSERTLVCNLNEGFPTLKQRYDVIVFSGVLEYIHDLETLMKHVRGHCNECIASYATTDQLESITTRAENGWVHHYSEAALTDIFKRAGFNVVETKHWQTQTIYRLQ